MLSPILSPSLAFDDIELLLTFETGSDELIPDLLQAYLLGMGCKAQTRAHTPLASKHLNAALQDLPTNPCLLTTRGMKLFWG